MRFCCSYVGGTFSYIYPGGPFCCNYADDCFCCNYVVRSFCSIYAGESFCRKYVGDHFYENYARVSLCWNHAGSIFHSALFRGFLNGGRWGCPPIPWIFLNPSPIKTHTPSWGTPSPHLKMKPPPPTEKQSPPIEKWSLLPENNS